MALLNGERVYKRLCEIFHRADERYNSGIFHFQKEKDRREEPDELTLGLQIDDKPLKEIIRNLYYPDSPYEFSVLPADILGQVYEQFLGKVIRLASGHRAVVEDKPEVKKAGGVYYTPTYIVDYIVKNTVGKLLEGKTPKIVGAHGRAPLRILDPACGSGSFLIGAYQYLLDWHRDWYVKDGPEKHAAGKQPVLFQAAKDDWRLTTTERKRILLNNIFGVDIDPQAVEVTKLSLLLKVLEGENAQTISQQLKFFHERALPDLGNNIKCGNSLIGPDFYAQQMNLLDDEERLRLNAFDWQAEFPEIMQAGGFDAVIGNPPYLAGREWEETLRLQRPYFKNVYSCMTDQYDIYALFIQKSIELLRPDGRFGFITPTTWLNNEHYISLREWLVEIVSIERLGDYRDANVFPTATVLPIVIIASRQLKPDKTNPCIVENFNNSFKSKTLNTSVSVWEQFPNLIFNLSISNSDVPILKSIMKISKPVAEWCDVRFGVKVYQRGKGKPPQTGEEAKQKLFEADTKKSDKYYPYIWGRHVKPWYIETNQAWLRYGTHLAEPRTLDLFTGPRIFVRRIVGNRLIVAPTKDTLIADQLVFTIKSKVALPDYRYIAGLLGSQLIAYYFRKCFNRTEKTFPEIRVAELDQLPIYFINFSDSADKSRHDRMVELVERMLALHKQLAAAKIEHEKTALQRQIEATDRQIDALVYELYGLTEEEIKIMEGRE